MRTTPQTHHHHTKLTSARLPPNRPLLFPRASLPWLPSLGLTMAHVSITTAYLGMQSKTLVSKQTNSWVGACSVPVNREGPRVTNGRAQTANNLRSTAVPASLRFWIQVGIHGLWDTGNMPVQAARSYGVCFCFCPQPFTVALRASRPKRSEWTERHASAAIESHQPAHDRSNGNAWWLNAPRSTRPPRGSSGLDGRVGRRDDEL